MELTVGYENVSQESTTVSSRRCLRHQNRRDASERFLSSECNDISRRRRGITLTSSTHASDDSCHQDEVRTLRSALQGTADKSKERPYKQPVYTADTICQPTSCETAKDGSEIVHTDDTAFVCGIGHSTIWEADTHCFNIARGGVDASHDPLIITFEEDRNQREDLNSNIELRWRQSLPQRLITHLEICRVRSVQDLLFCQAKGSRTDGMEKCPG